MFFVWPRILFCSNCILILIMSNLAISAPLKSQKHSTSERGFSASPRVLEIQLPLKITSKEDLVAWSKYVMSLITSKINSKNGPPIGKRISHIDNSDHRTKEMTKKASPGEKRQGINYPARRLKGPPVQRGDERVMAYPLPIGGVNVAAMPNPRDNSDLTFSYVDGATDFGQYANFNIGYPFHQGEYDNFENFELLVQPPAATYLPLPSRTTNIAAVDKNVSGFEEPAKLPTTKKSFNHRVKDINNELGQILPFIANDRLIEKNLSLGEPLLTVPFQALITITGQLPEASKAQPKDYLANYIGNPSDEFLPYFENNYTITNESRNINVLNDPNMNTSGTRVEENIRKANEEEERQGRQEKNGQKKKSEKATESAKQKSRKRQSAVLGDLLRMLGILRKAPKNATEINIVPPILSILRAPQKVQVEFDDTAPNRGRRNETFQAQQLNDDDDDDDDDDNDDDGNDGNGNGNEVQEQGQQQNNDDEEGGGSVQAVLDLLPLAAPILEDLSDPESDVDIVELITGAIPLLEGLSDPNEEGGFDIPAVLAPLSQKLSGEQDGQGSNSGAILGPLIQLIAPLIGPLSGPLIGPLSRTSSGGDGNGSGAALAQASGPLSEPQGPYGQSILSGLIASITAKLSKELAASAGESDVKSLVSSIVSGVIAGASAGSSGQKGYRKPTYGQNTYGQKDTYDAQTSYDSYKPHTYQDYSRPQPLHNNYYVTNYSPLPPSIKDMIAATFKEVLGAFVKLSGMSSTSSAGLSGASSSSSVGLSASSSDSSKEPPKQPAYGQGGNYGYNKPPSTAYQQRQKRHLIKRL